MIFSYNWLQSYFKKKLPKPEKLAEILTMRVFEVERLEKKGNPARNASQAKRSDAGGDWVLDIDVLPNRGTDCFSHLGIAREIAAITNYKTFTLLDNKHLTGQAKHKPQITNKSQTKDFIEVEVEDKNACPRYTARVVTDVKVGQSPKWIQERLKVCGLRPINNIVDITNYVMLETGQPLHAFDFRKIESVNPNSKSQIKKIIIRKAKKGERITTLDNERYNLDEKILIIADKEEPLAIAGIKGGKKAEIDKNTKTIILEAANFEMRTIRKARQKLKLQTDASLRFEHNLDPNLTETAVNRAANLIQEIAEGRIAKGINDFYPKKVLSKNIKLDLNYVEKLLGVKIPKKEIIKIFQKLDFTPIDQSVGAKENLLVEIPTFRQDITIPEDLVEEVGRIYGYDKIKSSLPFAVLIPPKRQENIFWQEIIKNILKEFNFTEVYNYSFISLRQVLGFRFQVLDLVEVENPMSIEQKYLRPSLIPNLLKNVKDNFKYINSPSEALAKAGDIRIFELGKTFINKQSEKTMLTGVIARKKAEQGFYELKGVVDSLLNKLGISDIYYDEYLPATLRVAMQAGQPAPEDTKLEIWFPGKCAEIKVRGEEIGFLGEISPELLEKSSIQGKVIIFNFDFQKLLKHCSEEQLYRPISPYPSAVRDLAILVPRDTKVVEILNKINIAAPRLVRDIDLFDIYEGEELPEKKKNLAFHIIYQAEDRTLTNREIDEVQQKIIKALEENPQWEIRR